MRTGDGQKFASEHVLKLHSQVRRESPPAPPDINVDLFHVLFCGAPPGQKFASGLHQQRPNIDIRGAGRVRWLVSEAADIIFVGQVIG